MQDDAEVTVAARIGKRLLGNVREGLGTKALKLKNPAPREQGAVDREVWILSGRADENDGAVFDPRQERVLLGLVEAVDLVDEEDGFAAVQLAQLTGFINGLANVGDPGQDGVDGNKMGAGGVGDDGRECGFARAGRAVENQGGELVGLNGAPQQAARAENVVLADVFV